MNKPMRIAITGAAGNIGYALAFRIASGDLLGKDQPVILHLVEIPQAEAALRGVVMELIDCAFPLVQDLVVATDASVGFKDIDLAFLVGAKPRGPGMERKDLLQQNARIFSSQGKALNEVASRSVRVLVVGNPANTNALIASTNAPELDPSCFSAMMRLDHNRALAQLGIKVEGHVTELKHMVVWGNHSATQFPDISHVDFRGQRAMDLVTKGWYEDTFIPVIQKRGAAIIQARGASSAASAASAAIDAMHDWVKGSAEGDWVSMSVPADGSYGVEPGIFYGYPTICNGGKYEIVQGLECGPFERERMKATERELREERAAIETLLS